MTSVSEAGWVSATDAQNNFGRVLSQVARQGAIFIEKYDRPTAVVLSVERYRELTATDKSELEELTREFDELLAHMQTDEAGTGTNRLFEMETEELGEAAVSGAEDQDG